ncbi:Hypothetical predicted protein [Octopus vulgaris]|uniref:Uncharacterized protein n=1 Tax=Octopus vulgaris TaxID=6645 RepID=A0AA36B9E3_OCTVU|nr:Hypothetical predicted protein [Octopus vulgaris]
MLNVKRYNGVIWNSIKLALRSRNIPVSQWEVMLPEVLHSQCPLLCTATNETPHERFFKFPRRSICGVSVPTWLMQGPDKVFVKRHVRNKYDPLVDEAQLVQINPNHGRVQYPDGHESTVSIRDLAPTGKMTEEYQLTEPQHGCRSQAKTSKRIKKITENYEIVIVNLYI